LAGGITQDDAQLQLATTRPASRSFSTSPGHQRALPASPAKDKTVGVPASETSSPQRPAEIPPMIPSDSWNCLSHLFLDPARNSHPEGRGIGHDHHDPANHKHADDIAITLGGEGKTPCP